MFVRYSSSGATNTIASVRTARLNTELLVSSASQWAMEMWKAKNASHIPTAPTTTTAVRYIYSQTKTEKLRLSVAEKNGAGQSPRTFSFRISVREGNTLSPSRWTRTEVPQKPREWERLM